MNFAYLLYQAERVKSPREQLEADIRAGERAKSAGRLLRSLRPAWRQPANRDSGAGKAIGRSCVTTAR
jgi:hypothetical protein